MKKWLLTAAFSLLAVPAAAQEGPAITCLGSLWTLSDRATLKDGVHVGAGFGDVYLCNPGVALYVDAGWNGSNNHNWYVFVPETRDTNGQITAPEWWMFVGIDRPAVPQPAEPPTTGYTVLIPISSTTMIGWDHDGVMVDGFEMLVNGGVTDLHAVPRQSDGHYEVPFPQGLPAGLYSFAIRAYNANGRSPDSSPISVTVAVAAPTVPATVTGVRVIQ